MLFQPAIIALLLASAVNVAMLFAIAPFAVEVIRHWDIASGSERQLKLERRTYLISALLVLVLATQLFALLLFVFNADRMSTLFVGAMCAVGTLNVNAYGFPALLAQIAVFFLSAMWLTINHADVRATDYPLVRVKYALLLGIAPVLVAVFVLELRYFLGLKADVLTSCCSRLFSDASPGLSSDLAVLPPLHALLGFYCALLLAIAASLRTTPRGRGGYALALSSLLAFAASIAGVLSFLSPYVYEHPNHHCPFCVLKAEYGYQGYLFYVPLFAATACGLSTGALQPFAAVPSLRGIVSHVSSRLAGFAATGFATAAVVASVIILRSNLILIEFSAAPSPIPGIALNLHSLISGVKP